MNAREALDAFYALYFEDETPRPDEEYIARFPEHEKMIAEELRRIRDGVDAPVLPAPDPERYDRPTLLDSGGMGVVFEAKDRRLARQVALKAPSQPADPTLGAELKRRFLAEARTTAKLNHPGIVAVHEMEEDLYGEPYFTMPLVAGKDLASHLAERKPGEGRPDLARWASILLRVCEALTYAHSQGIVHRDIKPKNIQVGEFGEVYVLDWGVAGHLDTAREPSTEGVEWAGEHEAFNGRSTQPGTVLGSPCYMAPEQARGDTEPLNSALDVYSAGAILYEMLVGHAPYEHAGATLTSQEILAAVRDHAPPPPSFLSRGLPAQLVAICEKAMARKPEQRFASMGLLVEDLWSFLEGRVVRSYRTGPLAELRAWVRRNRLAAVALGVLGALLVAGPWMFLRWNERESRLSADLLLVGQLDASAEACYPDTPENLYLLDDWLRESRSLLERLPLHEGFVATEGEDQSSASASDRVRDARRGKLVDTLQGWRAGKQGNLFDRMTRRRAEVIRIQRESTTSQEALAAWGAVYEELGTQGFAAGLTGAPCYGLLPLGQDPLSGLWEFAYLPSGSPPGRNGETDQLVLTPESSMVFVLLFGGTHRHGAQNDDHEQPYYDSSARDYEGPVHTIELNPFLISKYEVSQAQWARLTRDHREGRWEDPPLSMLPIHTISWHECKKVGGRFGLELPTEAQWEFAARGAKPTRHWTGRAPESLEGAANIADLTAHDAKMTWGGIDRALDVRDGYVLHAPIDALLPNPYGLHHVLGNVWEWCKDIDVAYSGPVLPGTGERTGEDFDRTARGGSFHDGAVCARTTARAGYAPGFTNRHTGFRPVLTLPLRTTE